MSRRVRVDDGGRTLARMHFAIVVFDGVDELDFVAPLEILRAARFGVTLCALDAPATIRCAHGLRVEVAARVPDRCDWLVVPGGGWASQAAEGVRAEIASGRIAREIVRLREGGAAIASVCTGAMLLSAAGVLHGRRATTHSVARAALAAEGAVLGEGRVVDDGDIVTAGGVTSGIDLALHLIGRAHGEEARAVAALRLEYPVT